jgi:hypothetical protein
MSCWGMLGTLSSQFESSGGHRRPTRSTLKFTVEAAEGLQIREATEAVTACESNTWFREDRHSLARYTSATFALLNKCSELIFLVLIWVGWVLIYETKILVPKVNHVAS